MEIINNLISYKKAVPKDIHILVDFRLIFLKEIYGNITAEQDINLRNKLKEYFSKSFQLDTCLAWLSEYNNQTVGLGAMIIREQPGKFTLPNGKTGYILNMYTVQEFRGKGICRKILEYLIIDAKERGIDRVELHASPQGEPIYRHIGFVEPQHKVLEYVL